MNCTLDWTSAKYLCHLDFTSFRILTNINALFLSVYFSLRTMQHVMKNRHNNIFDKFFKTTSNPYHYLFHKNYTIISLQFSFIQDYIDTVCLPRSFDFVHLDSTCRRYFMDLEFSGLSHWMCLEKDHSSHLTINNI